MKYMQWIALSAAAAGVAACCIGCARPGGKEASASQKLGGSFTAEMIMEMEDLTASGTISRIGEGQWSVAFAEPASLAGVVLDFSGDTVSASYQGLGFSVPQSAMPAKSVLVSLIQAVDTLAKEEKITGTEKEGEIYITEELDGSPYTLSLTKSGDLAGFSVENMDASLTFSAFQSGAAPIATMTAALETTAP